MASALTFFVSDVRVEVRSELDEVIAALAVVWGRCSPPLLSPVRVARFEACPAGGGYAVRTDAGVRPVERREDVLPVLESAIYAALPGWHTERVLLHAACVRRGADVVLLLGRSGAGKSSLALAAVRAGFDYFTDELTVTDGSRVWGVPRALQFEPVHDGDLLPPWIHGIDRHSYPLRLGGEPERVGHLPLWLPPAAQVASAPAPVDRAHVYAIERGARTELSPCSSIEALAVLHEAAFRPPQLDLGGLLGAERCGRLRWLDPDAAVEALRRRLER